MGLFLPALHPALGEIYHNLVKGSAREVEGIKNTQKNKVHHKIYRNDNGSRIWGATARQVQGKSSFQPRKKKT